MLIAGKRPVSVLEAIIIYLSAGAPFGALEFFSRKASGRSPFLHSIFATVGWPIIGAKRLFLRAQRYTSHAPLAVRDDQPLEVLKSLLDEAPVEPAELFEIAGHSNPWIATVCYTRSRNKVICSHIDRLRPESTIQATENEPHASNRPAETAALGS